MSQYNEGPCKTFLAATALGPHLRVKVTSVATNPPTVGLAGTTDPCIGTVERRALATGDAVTVRLVTAEGTCKMVASGVITGGNPAYAGASGMVAGSGTVIEGRALATTATSGDVVEVVRCQNSDISTAIAGTTASTFETDTDSTAPKIGFAADTDGSGDYTTWLAPEATLSGDNTIVVPEADGDTLVAVALTQTLTNKTLTSALQNEIRLNAIPGAASSARTLLLEKTGITSGAATSIITLTCPNASHAAAVEITLVATIVGTRGSTRIASGIIAFARTSGANLVGVVSTLAQTGIATVAAAETLTAAYGVATVGGAVGASNTMDIQVTLTASAATACDVILIARLINFDATGMTMAAAA